MKQPLVIGTFALTIFNPALSYAAESLILGPENKIPPYYKASEGGCRPGRGYSLSAQATNHPSTYPKMNLRVFNGEVIGFVFEVDAKDGWKPWYDQPEGKPTSHDGSIQHYTQTIYVKKGPTADECKASKGAYGNEK
jgi:hypothetical protein